MTSPLTVAPAVATALVLMATTPVGAQWLKDRTPGIPPTPDGTPNLSAARSSARTSVEFFTDDKGGVTHFVVRTVEGDQTATRKK